MTTIPSDAARWRDEVRLHELLFPDLFALAQSSRDDEADLIDEAAQALKEPGGMLATIGLTDIRDGRVRTAFERSIRAAREVFDTIGVDAPELTSWTAARVDLERLARAAAEDPSLTLVPAPHGLGPHAWKQLFARAVDWERSPLQQPGLILAREIEEEFPVLDRVFDASLPRVRTETGEPGASGRRLEWTLRLIPADARPALVGYNHTHATHPSLPEMLSLQLQRIRSGRAPVDEHSFTWIAGHVSGSHVSGSLAPRHVFDATEGVVRVSCRAPANQGPHLGARPPVD